jgi:hypothetical protein
MCLRADYEDFVKTQTALFWTCAPVPPWFTLAASFFATGVEGRIAYARREER